MMKHIAYIFSFLFFTTNLISQITFTAETDAKEVAVGEYIDLKFTLKNAQGSNFRSPVLSDFMVANGPNRMNSMTIVNGQASSSESYSFTLQAKREGTFTIGSASITAKGQYYSSQPLTITVKKGTQQTESDVKDAKGEVFLRADISANKTYVGQQIILDYKLYAAINVNGIGLVAEPSYDGFYKEDVNNFTHTDQRVTIGNKTYITRILKRIALFTQREGTQTIEPIEFRLNIPVKQNRGEDNDPFGLFLNSVPSSMASNVSQVIVRNLPAPTPKDFSGIVGEMPKAELILTKNTATTDDVISLKLTITSTGDPKRIQVPLIESTNKYTVSEPKTSKEEHSEQQGAYTTTKIFEYFVTPKDTGDIVIAPTLSYFDVKEEKYKSINLSPVSLSISQGKNVGIKTIATNTDNLSPTTKNVWWMPFLIGLAACFMAGVGYLIMKNKKQEIKTEKKQPAISNAQRVVIGINATKQLADIEPLYNENSRRYYEEISKTLFKYAQERLDIPLSDFSKTGLQNTLRQRKVSENNIHSFIEVLNTCERSLFAGANASAMSSPKLTQTAISAVHAIEKEIVS